MIPYGQVEIVIGGVRFGGFDSGRHYTCGYVRRGASDVTLAKRARYGGRKGRSARRRLFGKLKQMASESSS